MNPEKQTKVYYSDSPIEAPEQDILGRNAFVEQFAQTIISRQSKESLVIAFYGPWGAGKSSVLNLLQQRIHMIKDRKIGIVRFDPWYFNSQEQLLQTFFAELSRSVSQFTKNKNILNIFKSYADTLSSISVDFRPKFSIGPISFDFGNITNKVNESPERIRRNIQKSISDADIKILVLIDNLDRLDPPELLLMFKLVRLCSDFPGFIFIMAFDHAQVLNLLKKGEVDINFLEKMIQVDIDLPVIEQTEIDRMIMKSLDEIVKDEDIHLLPETSDRLYEIYKKHVSGLAITNLRSAKRYLNAVTFSLPLIKNEVDYADFLLLEVIRVFYPEIHEIVYVHKEHFISYDPIVWDERATFRYETPPERKGFFEKLQRTLSGYNTVSEQVIKGLLRKLFPAYNAYQENPSEPSPVKYSRDNVVHKRLADTTHFSKYFQLQILNYDIRISELEQFIQELIEEPDKKRITVYFEKYSTDGKLPRFFNKLITYLKDIPIPSQFILIQAISDYSGNFNDKLVHADLDNSVELTSVSREAIQVIEKSLIRDYDNQIRNDSINYILNFSASIRFALLCYVNFSRKMIIEANMRDDFNRMLANRMNREIVQTKVNIFEKYPDTYDEIITLWADPHGLNKQSNFETYLFEMMNIFPEIVFKFLLIFLVHDDETGKNLGIDYDRIKSYINVHHIISAIRRLPLSSDREIQEAQAISWFSEYYFQEYPEMVFRTEDEVFVSTDQEQASEIEPVVDSGSLNNDALKAAELKNSNRDPSAFEDEASSDDQISSSAPS